MGALGQNTTASNNTAVGYQAGYSNTTGLVTAIGYQALYSSGTNNGNTAVGYLAGFNATGYGNLFLGYAAGRLVTTGNLNTFVGSGDYTHQEAAGYYVTTGSSNTIIGNYNGNQGGLDIRTSSNYIVLSDGNGNPRLYCDNGGSWTTTGAIGIGATPSYPFDLQNASNQNIIIYRVYSSQYSVNTLSLKAVAANSASSTNAAMYVGQNSGSSRSINAGGTVNASGADYAEYMVKASNFTIAKGDICGINADGKLTNVFADAISFVVKSTNPSYVGGDSWFTEQEPTDQSKISNWEARMEVARQTVDRIAFAGQVPVNVTNATVGQYIVPIANSDGSISGQAISESAMTLQQYIQSVGKVISVINNVVTIIVKVS
jgi:hypothetical protein